MSALDEVHKLASKGFATGTNDLYDRARPSYQSNQLAQIYKQLGQKTNINVVECGSGTGIFTRALLAHPDWKDSIAALKAIEPSEGMRTKFTETVKDERVTVSEGTFSATGVEDGWADVVFVAQAFHWCPDYNAAAKEFNRILKKSGGFFLVWNMEHREGAAWVHELRLLYEEFEQGSPQFRLGLWRQLFDTPSYKSYFLEHEQTVYSYTIPATYQTVEDRVCSKSYIAVLPEDQKNEVKAKVKALVDRGDGKVWIDESKGIFQYPYQTYIIFAKKRE